ncbi:MAG: helix-turn-helix domain-containing protein [Desulfovibrio sp.]|nr:helix-turn-helix domain-containing protein [Desulfovibrio sp.]
MNPLLENLRSRLPQVLTRRQVAEYLGDFISVKYLANLDSEGKGPKAYRFGKRKVLYERDDMLAWLDGRIKPLRSA